MPQFIEVEYDPFAPVPVDHDPWEGQSDPFAYQHPQEQQLAGNYSYQPPLTQEEINQYLQRPPVALDVEPARPVEAWFERPSWLQGETPEGYAQPYPSPSGISGNYSRGKLIGPQSPLRGTYRHVVPF